MPHVAWKVWFDTVVREYRLKWNGSMKALAKVQKVVDEYLPEMGDEDGFKWAHRVVCTEKFDPCAAPAGSLRLLPSSANR